MEKKLQVLVATMNQTDFSLVDKMNLHGNAILANQTDHNAFDSVEYPFGRVDRISTTTRGVGLNRNIALLAADADILLFADDDVTYYDGALDRVIEAFRSCPRADVLIFSMDYTRGGEIIERRHLKTKRLHLWNAMRYGACALAVRRQSLLKANIQFNQLFGGGCLYGSGEDSLFLRDCFRHKLRVWSHETVLGRCSRDSSSWFTGCDAHYFYDKGAMMRYLFPHTYHLMVLRFAICFKKPTELNCRQRINHMRLGLRGGKMLCPYSKRFEYGLERLYN